MNVESRTPVVTLLLIAANIGAAFFLFLQPEVVDQFGFVASDPQLVPALACLFLHANLLHLLGNMVFLAAAGPATESAVGSLRFFGVYMAGGLAGVAAHWMLSPAKDLPLIGASGAVTACVALGAVRFHRSKVVLAPSLSVPLLIVVVVWIALQLAGGLLRIGEETGGTSYWAHAGGAVAGLLLALVYRAPQEADRRESHRVLLEMAHRGPAASLSAAEKHLEAHPGDIEALVQRAEALAQLGERQSAAQAFLSALDSGPKAEQEKLVERMADAGCFSFVSSMKRIQLAEKLKLSNVTLAATLLESIVAGPLDDDQRPEAILALADLRRESDPEAAQSLATELFRAYPLHPATEVARAKGWSA